MTIELAIDTLEQYKFCNQTRVLEEKYPHEMQRRETYLDNVIRQLRHCEQEDSSEVVHLIADDIRHCMLHKYYPILVSEDPKDGFNFHNTLADVVRLLELEDPDPFQFSFSFAA